ncbi:polysaccharide deacetylase family protein [Clostridium aminobutyricum]|uniref:Polysaccharide deacetylase n=1 Tax=Clostridium aminobutyricum TaxID=33953 RepID=A0A939DAB1_CLOAM|nr:polysaccharide deacetylase family protein [Clostridium aminobutyricum]MBN7774005.1 polysaccharide deacetylase [Clostridium aminobutyricum]
MEERSVTFYKRLIIITALSILIIIMGLLTFFIGNVLEVWNSFDKEVSQKASNQLTINSDNGLSVKPTTAAGVATKQNSIEKEEKTAEHEQEVAVSAPVSEKVVYLTFDDGPSQNTTEILKILEEEQVKATFFFNTTERKHLDSVIKEAFDEGHAVGVLTSTGNDYDTIYASVNSYIEDFQAAYDRIYDITGVRPTIFRFPGGSINGYNKNIYPALIEEMKARGYVYFDWNVCAQDYSRAASQADIVKNATKIPHRSNECIVLMHDIGYDSEGSAIKEIIQFYRANGYSFQKLSKDVKPITF